MRQTQGGSQSCMIGGVKHAKSSLKKQLMHFRNVTPSSSSTTNQLTASKSILSEQILLAFARLIEGRSCAPGEVVEVG